MTPGLDDGPAGTEARRVDLAGLTPEPGLAGVGPRPRRLARADRAARRSFRGAGARRPTPWRTTWPPAPSSTPWSPAGRGRGLLAGPSTEVRPAAPRPATRARARAIGLALGLPLADGPAGDEPLGHALAALDAAWVFLAASAVAGHEERLRRFAGVLRACRRGRRARRARRRTPRGRSSGSPCGRSRDGEQTFLALANDTPYPIRLAACWMPRPTAVVDDLGRGLRLAPAASRGGRHLVLDLLPFGVSAVRVGAPRVRVASVTAYPSEAVLAGMQAQSRELSLRLARLNQGPAPSRPSRPTRDSSPPRPRRRRPAGRARSGSPCRRCPLRRIRG